MSDHGWKETLLPGETCWRLSRSPRVSALVESDVYFSALREACRQARRNILIVGWDFDRHERVGREDNAPGFGKFFNELLERNDQLQVWLLSWDYNLIYAAEREWFQEIHLQHGSSRRFHVCFDSAHPAGGSQHQKLVVIDDRLAFCGGIDLSRWRWDTREHAPQDDRRTDPDGEPYQPFHDAMLLVEGEAARDLGDLARERWSDSAASQVPPAAAGQSAGPDAEVPEPHDSWPSSVSVLWTDQQVAIARTMPDFDGREAVREVEQLYLQSIARARDYIYIENQYFTSRSIASALGEQLSNEQGPDVVIVLPQQTGGWLEQVTMDALRDQRIEELRECDRHGRLRVVCPHQPGLEGDDCIMVHSKLMIADDCFVRIGSANTSNRSMGLDSECDLALVDGAGDGARSLLYRLLGEHLDVQEHLIAGRREEGARLTEVVDELMRAEGRSLRAVETSEEDAVLDVSNEEDLVDPDEPIDAGYIMRRTTLDQDAGGGKWRLISFAGLLLLLLLLGAGVRWTPLGELLSADALADGLAFFDDPRVRFLAVFVVIAITSVLMVPLSALVVASALVLGPWQGFIASMAGGLVSAAIAFTIGELVGGSIIQRYDKSRVHELSKRLSDRGIVTVALLRLVPVAPYTIVNIVAGASHLQLGKFLIGSAIGLVPGLLALSWFSGSLLEAVRNPDGRSLGILAVVFVLIVGGTVLLRRLLRNQ